MFDRYTRVFIWFRSGDEEAITIGIIANIINKIGRLSKNTSISDSLKLLFRFNYVCYHDQVTT
jgi:hypothetical protein